MKVNEHDLRRLYQEHIKAQVPLSRQRCPSFDRLARFFEGRLSKRAKRVVIDHVTLCAPCYQEFNFLSQVSRYEDSLAQQISGAHPAPRRGVSLLSFVYHQVAALVILGLLLSVAFIFWRGTPRSEERGKPPSLLTLVQPAGRSALVVPFNFRWKDNISAREYVVELFDDSLRSLWKSDRVAGTSASLSPEKLRILVPGHTYFWMVTAYSAGATVAESDLQEFIITGR
jgi:hypothetical protein